MQISSYILSILFSHKSDKIIVGVNIKSIDFKISNIDSVSLTFLLSLILQFVIMLFLNLIRIFILHNALSPFYVYLANFLYKALNMMPLTHDACTDHNANLNSTRSIFLNSHPVKNYIRRMMRLWKECKERKMNRCLENTPSGGRYKS